MSTDAVAADQQLEDINPGAIDWDAIFEEYADEEGALSIVDRTRALKERVDAVEYDDEAETILHEASERGLIELKGDGRVFLEGEGVDEIAAADVDWRQIWEQSSNTELWEPIGHSKLMTLASVYIDNVRDEDHAGQLITEAGQQGVLLKENSGYSLPGEEKSVQDNAEQSSSQSDQKDGQDLPPEYDGFDELDQDEKFAKLLERQAALEKENNELKSRLNAFETQVKRLVNVVAGEDLADRLGDSEETFVDLISRVEDVEEQVTENEDRIEMYDTTEKGRSDPDSRAVHLRQILFNKCSRNKKARISRDEAGTALGGDLHRGSVIDAMKRAADGRNAGDAKRNYTPINGSSDLKPIDGITFIKGKGKSNQSKVEMDLTDVTQTEMRQNLTTENAEEGG